MLVVPEQIIVVPVIELGVAGALTIVIGTGTLELVEPHVFVACK